MCRHFPRSSPRSLTPERQNYDSRSQIDERNNPDYRADNSVWWIFPVDLADGQEQQVHGKPTSSEFLPRRTRPRGCHSASFTHLPSASGRGCSTHSCVVVCPNRNSAGGDSHFVGLLLLRTATDRHTSKRSNFPDLHRGTHSRSGSCRTRRRA